jgi:stage II sporulation protein D
VRSLGPARLTPWRSVAAGIAVAVAVVASCRTAPRAPVVSVPEAATSGDAYVAPPRIRVAILTGERRVSIGADAGVVVWEAGRPTRVPRATFLARSAASAPKRFGVQVASLRDENAAALISDQARRATGEDVNIRPNAASGTFQVRVGSYESRDDALSLAARLGKAGLPGGFVTEDLPADAADRVRLLEADQEFSEALIVPTLPQQELWVDGASYRGVLEVRLGDAGLTVVNIVHMEDYLRGVVPNELSPMAYPQIEALKAQAIAARTYALRNLGQFAAKGYDICATPACQVYRGRGSEHVLSDQAVSETRGQIAAWRGKPVNALYTSTCGGHTENASNVFDGETATYLRGVSCTPERSAWNFVRTGAPQRAVAAEPGRERDVAQLQALEVLADPGDAAALKSAASAEELRRWTSRLVVALHRKGCSPGSEVADRGAFFVHLVSSLCWEERAQRLLAPGDAEYLLQVEDRDTLKAGAETRAAGLLVQEGILPLYPDNTLRPRAVVSRGEALQVLAATARRAGAPGLISAEFRGLEGSQLEVAVGDVMQSYPLDSQVRLFRALDGSPLAASALGLAAGDRVNLVARAGLVTFLESEQSRLGASADRNSRYYRWETRLSPAEIAGSIARYGSVGKVQDVVPRRLGVSGRVIELQIVGSDGELVLTGLKIRWALGLRENLFVIDREIDADGGVARFVFTGKGWGHGVGLCQVGASGMARAGATAEEILKHYYTGIEIAQSY